MSKKEKLIERLKTRPKDFTFDEVETLLRYFGYRRSDKGRTSGSRVMFVSDVFPPVLLHKPHPGRVLLDYQMKQLIDILKSEDLI